ncbi:hypothetical protein ABZ671_18530 [Micromonospora sp. NPDC006766]|uniref:hypothetical protein n=1 Tax=Micromonospora sp. NPDC006766 TaxID=3154778 RepID=UPI0033C98567
MSQLVGLLPGLGAFGTFATAVVILARMIGHDRGQLDAADARYKQEAADHEETQAKLDQQMRLRRQAEDTVAKLGRKVDALIEQMAAQGRQIAAQSELIQRQTEVISEQTERIQHLEREVAQLSGAARVEAR